MIYRDVVANLVVVVTAFVVVTVAFFVVVAVFVVDVVAFLVVVAAFVVVFGALVVVVVPPVVKVIKSFLCNETPVNRTACFRHQCRKTTVLSFHRCLIYTGVEKMKNI
jgi:hypothetical protein